MNEEGSVESAGSEGREHPAGEILVERGVSRFGLQRLHVMRAGCPVERERWLGRVGGRVEAVVEYEDEDLGLWHLRIYWRVDEPVSLQEVDVPGRARDGVGGVEREWEAGAAVIPGGD